MKDHITSTFKLSFLPNVHCHLKYSPDADEWTIEFLRDGQSIGKFSLLHDQMTEDNLMREIADCRALQLTSTSAIYEIIEEIYKEIEMMSGGGSQESESSLASEMSSGVAEDVVASVESDHVHRLSSSTESSSLSEMETEVSETLSIRPTEKLGQLEVSGTDGMILVVEATDQVQTYLLTFSQHGRNVAGPLVLTELTEDSILDVLSSSGIEFYSLSAMYDLAEKTLALIQENIAVPEEEEVESELREIAPKEAVHHDDEESLGIADQRLEEGATVEADVMAIPEETFQKRPRVTEMLKELELPYTGGHRAQIKLTDQPNTYAILILDEEGNERSDVLFVSNPDEDKLIELLDSTNVDFVSISALSDSAELILQAMSTTHQEEETQGSESPTETELDLEYQPSYLMDEGDLETRKRMKPLDITEIRLPSLDHLREPEDFETYISEMKKALSENQPILIASVPISGAASKSMVKIYRQGEDGWYMSFSAKNFPESKLYPLKAIDLDEVARLMNDHVPQISMSALVEQAEKVFEILHDASQRPREDMIINQAVNHFAKILDEHEASGNLEKATRLAMLLLNKFRDVQNPHGLMEFGMRLTSLLERQNKTEEATGWIIQIFEDLMKIGHKSSLLTFASSAIEWLTKPEISQFLEAARFSRELYNIISSEEEANLDKRITWLEKTVNCYCKANITLTVIDFGITESLTILEHSHERYKTDKTFTRADFLEIVEKVTTILSMSLNYLEEHANVFEVVDSYKSILFAFEQYKLLEQLLLYAERAITFYKDHGLTHDLLELSLRLSEELMTKDYHEKATKFSYLAIQLMHKQKEDPRQMLDICYKTLDGLLNLRLTRDALKHAEFTEQLALSLFSHDNEEISLMYEKIASILLEHDLADHASIYLQKMIQIIKIPDEVMQRILKFIERLMDEDKVKIAQNLVNFELSRQIQQGNPQNVAKVSQEFTKMLLKHQHLSLAFDYLKYTYQCYYQVNDPKPAIELFHQALPTFIAKKRIDEAKFLIEYIVQYHVHLKEETRAIDALKRFIDLLIENDFKGELLEEFIFKAAKIFEDLGDVQGSISLLIEYRDLVQKHDIKLARKLTEESSKRLIDHYEDYNQAVDVLKPLAYQFLEKNDLENAYLYTLQVVGYYELAGDVAASIDFLEEIKPKILEKQDLEISVRILDFTYRHYLKFNKTEEAFKTAKDLLAFTEEHDLFEESVEAVEKIVNVLMSMKRPKDAIDVLEEKISSFVATRKPGTSSKLSALTSLYLELIQEHESEKERGKRLLSVSQLLLDHDEPELALPFIYQHFGLEKRRHPDDAINYLLQQVELLIRRNYPAPALQSSLKLLEFLKEINRLDAAEEIMTTIIQSLLDNKLVSTANQLVESYFSYIKGDSARVIKLSLSFVKMLISANLVSHARDYVERIIKDLSSRPDFQTNKELQQIIARILERFALNLQDSHPELYIEYAYRAATQYLKVKNVDKCYQIFLGMAEHLPTPTAEKVLKRGVRLLGPIIEAQTMKFSLLLRIFVLQLRQKSRQKTLNDTMNEMVDTLLQTHDLVKISEELAYLFVSSIKLGTPKETILTAMAPHVPTIKKKIDENSFVDAFLQEISGIDWEEVQEESLRQHLDILRGIMSDRSIKTIEEQIQRSKEPDIKKEPQFPLSSIEQETKVPSISLLKIKENLQDLKKELSVDVDVSPEESLSSIPTHDDDLISTIEEDEQFVQLPEHQIPTVTSLEEEMEVINNLQNVIKGTEPEMLGMAAPVMESESKSLESEVNEDEFLKSFEETIAKRSNILEEFPDLSSLQVQSLDDSVGAPSSSTAFSVEDKTLPKGKEKEKVIKDALKDLNELIKSDDDDI